MDPDPYACIKSGESHADLWRWKHYTETKSLAAAGFTLDKNDHFLCRAQVPDSNKWYAGYLINSGQNCQLITRDEAPAEFELPNGVAMLEFEWQREDYIPEKAMRLSSNYSPELKKVFPSEGSETWCWFYTDEDIFLGVLKVNAAGEKLCRARRSSPGETINSNIAANVAGTIESSQETNTNNLEVNFNNEVEKNTSKYLSSRYYSVFAYNEFKQHEILYPVAPETAAFYISVMAIFALTWYCTGC
ncbi:hypothetical protein EOPP23_07025 [Endozoicomonas sp. OPT23]|nr:hypothetical protein [Endozoicomonas sp. OPT23]